MKVFLVTLFILCLSCALTAMEQARGWQGLVPLRSTRADVERLLGQPTEKLSTSSVFYRTPNETVVITYTDGLPCGVGEKYSRWRVPRDTVQSILVTPTGQLPVSKLELEESKYQKRSGGHSSDSFYYMNDDDGVSIRVFMGNVMSISLYPGRVDAHLSCSPPAATADCESLAPPAMDSYRSLTIQQERLRLDNFAIALWNSPDATGYIIAYGGKSAQAGEANVLGERAKRYLTEVRHLSPERLKVINGGFREKNEVELFVLPHRTCPPVADPTLDPRDAQIIRSHKSDARRRRSPH